MVTTGAMRVFLPIGSEDRRPVLASSRVGDDRGVHGCGCVEVCQSDDQHARRSSGRVPSVWEGRKIGQLAAGRRRQSGGIGSTPAATAAVAPATDSPYLMVSAVTNAVVAAPRP